MHKLLPFNIPRIDVVAFDNASSAMVLNSARNRRVFGIVNNDVANIELRLQDDGSGLPIILKAATISGGTDGGSMDLQGYNGAVWVKGTGYIYHFSE